MLSLLQHDQLIHEKGAGVKNTSGEYTGDLVIEELPYCIVFSNHIAL